MKKSIVLFLLLSSNIIFSQFEKEIYTNMGISHLSGISWDENLTVENLSIKYNYAPSVTFGFGISKKLNDFFRINTALELNSNAVLIKVIGDFDDDYINLFKNKTARFYNASIPVFFSYSFEEYLHFNLGLTNNFHLINSTKVSNQEHEFKAVEKMNLYSLGYLAGFDFLIKEKYKLGVNFQKDLTASVKEPYYEIYHYFDQINLRLGYRFK